MTPDQISDRITFGSLFAGIGGFDLGLEWAGMKCVWQVEQDKYCSDTVLIRHWPDVERFERVEFCGCHNLQPVDLICGGFPCQPVSLAGKRMGDADERWLWPEFCRIIREIRPAWALIENSPGLLSADAGRLMRGILWDIAEIGYDAEWDCIPAQAVGANHERDRLFIVAYPESNGEIGLPVRRQEEQVQATAHAVGNGEEIPDANGPGQPLVFGGTARSELAGLRQSCGNGWWGAEPDVGRVAHGVPKRVDRIRGLGNAVVPQVAEWIGRRIVKCLSTSTS